MTCIFFFMCKVRASIAHHVVHILGLFGLTDISLKVSFWLTKKTQNTHTHKKRAPLQILPMRLVIPLSLFIPVYSLLSTCISRAHVGVASGQQFSLGISLGIRILAKPS